MTIAIAQGGLSGSVTLPLLKQSGSSKTNTHSEDCQRCFAMLN